MSEKENKKNEEEVVFNNDSNNFGESGISMAEFTYLINSIVDYYSIDLPSEGEEWKFKSKLKNKSVPEEVDKEVKKAFLTQLKKFQD